MNNTKLKNSTIAEHPNENEELLDIADDTLTDDNLTDDNLTDEKLVDDELEAGEFLDNVFLDDKLLDREFLEGEFLENELLDDEDKQTSGIQFGGFLRWFTIEIAFYLLIILIALGLRLNNLTIYPLNNSEATQALVAWQIYQGQPVSISNQYSPAMASLNSLGYFLFGDSDWSARLIAALLGTVVVILPFGLRSVLGKWGAIIASLLLALSPINIFWSRQVSGDIVVAVGLLLIIVGGVKWFVEENKQGVYLSLTGILLLLLGSPIGYSALAIFISVGGIILVINKTSALIIQQSLNKAQLGWQQLLPLAVGLLLLLGSAWLLNLPGLASISNTLNQWLTQFGLGQKAEASYPIIFILIIYELLILVFGGIGVITALWKRDPFDWLLGIWITSILILDLFMGGRGNGQILLISIPLTLLAGKIIGNLYIQWKDNAQWESDGFFISTGLIISTFVYITLLNWTRCAPEQAGCQFAWSLPLVGIGILIGLALTLGAWYGPQMAWRSFAAVLIITLGSFYIGATWRLNYAPLKDLPYQPLQILPTSSKLPPLLKQITQLSTTQIGQPDLIDITIVNVEAPLLKWYLRDFTQSNYVENFNLVAENSTLILARPDAGEPLSGSYVGQEFALISHWNPTLLQGKEWIRWYMLRLLPTHIPGSDQIVLWVKVN